ncbi:hypothetical protein QMS56_02020 [Cronobacter malonaticus]|uniref:Uncharacterized protein n=1 Tax=Cronobacter malonaticus TaxID=413503 RepID=V5TZS7_9ENTR|nr:hypothetical protein [Cronobacter malonaticus]CCJ92653.1 FIG00554856: hypothetical protein [Cronobacter malonaticus 681]AHB70442.1 hypothetical protein P262_02915 [Cronobacter malonaticus]ALX78668.1 hypothetical protein AFK66_009705 [Cronobacter malonaticus LMG 23826]EGT4279631.1 hypothetical protein [Cronobacter malonaticus]EGT4298137.1 hypothetical protein [Cronobacter malonaticus]
MTRIYHCVGLATLALASWPCLADPSPATTQSGASVDNESEPIQAGVFTSRWGRLFSGNDKKFSGALSFNSGLKEQYVTIPNSSDTATQTNKINQTVNLSLQYSPWSYLFANVTLRAPVRDLTRYSSDFRYSFGYDDWHANTFSLVYSNYGDNHIWPSGNKRHTYFEQGGVTAAYKFSLPKPLEKHLLINKGDSIICQVGYTWVPRYYDLNSNDIRSNKNVLLGGCGYTLKQHFFLRATAFWFPDSSQQQPWNGDYSYSFGYAGYTPGTFSIQYANYSGTRYPGHASGNGKFREGTVSLIWYLPL